MRYVSHCETYIGSFSFTEVVSHRIFRIYTVMQDRLEGPWKTQPDVDATMGHVTGQR